MSYIPNQRFAEVIEFLKNAAFDVKLNTASQELHKEFLSKFPSDRVNTLTLNEYCIGTGTKDSFCWWIEFGLIPVLGRYMPGTSKGHIVYRKPDGSIYKNRRLLEMADEDALSYILKVQSVIANADPTKDLLWIDDDSQIYERAEVEPITSIGDGRKLRLLSCYNPDVTIPISSSEHLKHFLIQLGFPPGDIPAVTKPIARMLLLREAYYKARLQIPGLTTLAFMRALYSPKVGMAPVREKTVRGGVDTRESIEELLDEDTDIEDVVSDAREEPPTGLNTILYGPPGTGKTYSTIDEALKILDPDFFDKNAGDRAVLKERFDELVTDERVRFVTFHQSFSYEDFVEGLRADSNEESNGQISYGVEKGVFQLICESAMPLPTSNDGLGVATNPRIWKISIDGTQASPTRQYCLEHDEARIGWGHVGDVQSARLQDASHGLGSNDQSTLYSFANEIQKGDVVLCIRSNTEVGAVGVVTGEYRHESKPPATVRSDYKNVLPVKWLVKECKFPILPLNAQKRFTLKAVYEMTRFSWPEFLSGLLATGIELPGLKAVDVKHQEKPHVLIIDEINRGNISRIFGELITLIEPSKRLGAEEALDVTLPYSKKRFGVPANVYLIGTMNTADRSLASLDIALRRRFTFKEMMPQPELLDKVLVASAARGAVNVGHLLRKLNQRIEVLLDRNHCLGHSYFLPLRNDPSLERLASIFRQQIVPLLQEYFFEDWERIRWVLNDQHKVKERCFISRPSESVAQLFGNVGDLRIKDNRWTVNDEAFDLIESYIDILKVPA